MADKNTKTTLILTQCEEYFENDKGLYLDPTNIACYIDTTDYCKEQIEEMKEVIAQADWYTFCAACEHCGKEFSVAEVMDLVNGLDDHYILLADVYSLSQVGRYIFYNFWEVGKYADICDYIDFCLLASDWVDNDKATETSFGYMLIFEQSWKGSELI